MLEQIQGSSYVVGLKQTLKMLDAEKVARVYMAKDTDYPIAARLTEECEKRGVPVSEVESKSSLGRAAHINVSASVLSVLK